VRYIEVIARVSAADAAATADILSDVTEAGVWVETPFSQSDLESDAQVDVSATHAVHAYIPADTDRAGVLLEVRQRLDGLGLEADIEARVVADEDWAESWKEHFHVERYGRRLVVVPSWREFRSGEGDVVIMLDPGMAFGTGQHETTRMCLEAIERALRGGERVLDIGSGSGILSIAAGKFGAQSLQAIDIDPVCVRVTQENASANGVDIRAAAGSLGRAWPFETELDCFDVILANIIARVIIDMAPEIATMLTPGGGRLIASGIIEKHEGAVVEALEACGLQIESTRGLGEWRCIEALRL
jgi:ribosomal protein L11 methyltransferase